MITLIVNIKIKEGAVEAWRRTTLENAVESRKEAGVFAFEVLGDRSDPTRFALIERYRDQAAVDDHKLTRHYLRWKEVAEPLQAEPRTRVFYDSLEPVDPR